MLGWLRDPLAVLIVYALTAMLWTPTVPLTDGYALKAVTRYGLNYGPLRLWGSAAFVVGALGCGLLIQTIEARHVIWVIVAMAACGAAASLALQPTPALPVRDVTDKPAPNLLRDPGFLTIIIASALTQGSHAAYYTFASIAWQNEGIGGLTIAMLWVLGVLAEIVLFALSPRLRWPPATLVILAALCAMLRWIVIAQSPPLWLLALVQLMHGITFGLTLVATMSLMQASCARRIHRSRAGLSRGGDGHRDGRHGGRLRRDLCSDRAGDLLRDGRDGFGRCGGDGGGAEADARVALEFCVPSSLEGEGA